MITEGLRQILQKARNLIAEEDYSVRDAVYESAVNGASDSAAIQVLYREGNLHRGVMSKEEVLAVFDRLIRSEE